MSSEAGPGQAGGAPRHRKVPFVDPRSSPIVRALGRLGWPILLKEIRADYRKNRFFFTHLICLSFLAAAILWQVAVRSGDADAKPERIGIDLFDTFFLVQYLVVVVIFPAFSASAISEERSAQTFDLLVTTDLRASEVVWGKFLACSVYCLVYIVATVPLLSISLLFAGVTLLDIGLAYLVLLGLTVLISIAGVAISSCYASALRSTLTMYVVSFGIILWTWSRYGELLEGLYSSPTTLIRRIAGQPEELILLAPNAAWGLWLFALAFAYLFLLAENQLRPKADDRQSKLRILTFAGILSFLVPPALEALGKKGNLDQGSFQEILLWTFAALFVVSLFFTAGEPSISRRLRARFSRWSGPLYPLRIFAPGPFWGLACSMALVLASCGILSALWLELRGRGASPSHAYGECLATIPIYLFAFAGLGFFLSTSGFSPLYTRLTVFFIFVIASLLPVIFKIGGRPDGILSLYYLSPITLWDSLDLSPSSDGEGPRYLLYGIPIIRVAQALFATAGVLFTSLGVKLSRLKGYPLLSFRGPAGAPKPPADRQTENLPHL